MLNLKLNETEFYDEEKSEFVTISSRTIQLEHSLVAISKWESKWHKSFLSSRDKTDEEILDYILCMSPDDSLDKTTILGITRSQLDEIAAYIEDSMTATVFYEAKSAPSREIITNEIIYYWMVAFNIPFECQHWHVNRLLTLIKVCSIKSQPEKKMSQAEIMARNRALNEARRKKLGTKG